MKKPVKHDITADLMCGIGFTATGALFCALTVILFDALMSPDNLPYSLMVPALGLLLLVVGIGLLVTVIKSRRSIEAVVEEGRYIWGEIIRLVPDESVTVNNRCTYRAEVLTKDFRGNGCCFYSTNLGTTYKNDLLGKRVKVYIKDGSGSYYVDMDSLS